jgi:hypothetical protein
MSAYRYKRHFTIEEANQMLSRVAPLVSRLRDAWKRYLQARQKSLQALAEASLNGKPRPMTEGEALAVVEDLVQQIQQYGCVVKGPGEGLVDFPALYESREIFLCWRLGEEKILAWHELDAGFANRKPLSLLETPDFHIEED